MDAGRTPGGAAKRPKRTQVSIERPPGQSSSPPGGDNAIGTADAAYSLSYPG
ncbi:hypothetical protein I545_0606 [Mycobacterium kansasii 662]|uniref:Uncharacterized protein n=2 Tax=Mycobacterium kansasii TaxID=1768 RepID=A0A1V3XWP1_MYCKA|nr:hypothetical protein I547_0738 [Mycobacterium kansasii 824]EUA21040.1 hypothetical protein I545_0606 [Mycobacterium kansasii 662]KEP43146.1 hypothetical protein MKSMC1_15330 [Mycobacterium kansasii]OOK83176.1 hypothetical protein BZL29_0713 [Mycobacterium kansasii]